MAQIKVRLSNGQVIEVENFTTVSSNKDGVTIEFTHEGKTIRASKAFALDGPYDPYKQQ